jgi:hypothetical protein
MSALMLVNRRYTCRNLPQQSLIQISFSSQSGHSQILIRRAVVGRERPIRRPTTMSGNVALRQAGNGQ